MFKISATALTNLQTNSQPIYKIIIQYSFHIACMEWLRPLICICLFNRIHHSHLILLIVWGNNWRIDIDIIDNDSDIDLKYSHFTHSSWAEIILIKTQNIFCPGVLTCSLPSELTSRLVRAIQSEAKDRGQQPIGGEEEYQWLTGGDGRTLGAQRKQLRSPPNNNAKNCNRFIFISFSNKRGQDQGCLKVEW